MVQKHQNSWQRYSPRSLKCVQVLPLQIELLHVLQKTLD